MARVYDIKVTLLIVFKLIIGMSAARTSVITLTMPNLRPDSNDTYLCSAQSVSLMETRYIVGYQPSVKSGRLHHLAIFGCDELPDGVSEDLRDSWLCSRMLKKEGKISKPVCKKGTKTEIIYVWALDAPGFLMPEGVGFKIGGNTPGAKHLVLQAHYADVTPFERDPHLKDDSGVMLYTVAAGSDSGITRRAGVLSLASGGYVEEGLSEHFVDCPITDPGRIHPIRIRTHSHGLGYNIGLIKVPKQPWKRPTIVAQHDPQQPQTFYPIEDERLTISRGDRLISYCQFNNTRGHIVLIGDSYEMEMCNVYLLYWMEGDRKLSKSGCGSMNQRRSYPG